MKDARSPQRGGDPRDEQHRDEIDLALRGDHAAEDDRGLARRDQADERAGLQEREAADESVRPRAERLREVGERVFEVRKRDGVGRHERAGGDRDGHQEDDPLHRG
jgi:hypothetical protein